ncbi:MAG TPA: hypothetical protein VE684_05180 [Crenalkalicoccus sp.]|nr:hypothetical protein [Crenalkalicoccus sp.]
MDRRSLLRASTAASLWAALPADLFAQSAAPAAGPADWDAGSLRHLLPTVSDTRMIIKASFASALAGPPLLHVGDQRVRGRMGDTRGEMWSFLATGLQPGRRYTLSLASDGGQALCAPWDLATFPAPDARPERLRVLFYTCAGGHEAMGFLPPAVRNRLLRRALSFRPDAAVANGDHVYWDLLAPRGSPQLGASPQAREIAGSFDRSAVVFGSDNETVLKRAAGPQIVPVYGTDFRSTPVFFIQDDHDYFDNDEATDEAVTFPPDHFMAELARASQSLYYPEFLPDQGRPAGLAGASHEGRALPISESFGTLRYGTLAEILLYTVRRTMTLAGPTAVFLDPQVEAWLQHRMAAPEVAHVVNVPSNPPGWSAGKWGEWYPDVLGADGELTIEKPKPYWQTGWLHQHDRLMRAISSMPGRVPLVMSGDLHALALGRMLGSGRLDLSANPVVVALNGPVGTSATGWPSVFRGIGPRPSRTLRMEEQVKPIEQHGFTLADFMPDRIVLRLFKWDVKTQPVEAIDGLEPFHTAELPRRS